MIKRNKYVVKFIAEYFNDDLYQFEVESKGCFWGVKVETQEKSYELSFYDTTRFKQDTDDELLEIDFVYEANVIFLKKVTMENMIKAIDKLWENNFFANLVSS